MASLPCAIPALCLSLFHSLFCYYFFSFPFTPSLLLLLLLLCSQRVFLPSSPWLSISLRHIQSRIGLQTHIHALAFLSAQINFPPLIPFLCPFLIHHKDRLFLHYFNSTHPSSSFHPSPHPSSSSHFLAQGNFFSPPFILAILPTRAKIVYSRSCADQK